MNVQVIVGANRVRGVSTLKGLKNDSDFFMNLAPKLIARGIFINTKFSKPIPQNTDLLIFSGHGGMINGNMVLLAPTKYKRGVNNLTAEDLITSNDLPENMNVIVDACYAGAFKNGIPVKFIKGLNLSKAEIQLDAQKPFTHTGIRSSDENSLSYEINVNGHCHGAMIYALETFCRLVSSGLQEFNGLSSMTNWMKGFLKTCDIMQDISYGEGKGNDKITEFLTAVIESL